MSCTGAPNESSASPGVFRLVRKYAAGPVYQSIDVGFRGAGNVSPGRVGDGARIDLRGGFNSVGVRDAATGGAVGAASRAVGAGGIGVDDLLGSADVSIGGGHVQRQRSVRH